MTELWHRIEFWVAVIVAAIIKVLLSENLAKTAVAVSIVSGLFAAAFGAHPLLDWLELDPVIYGPLIGGLLALTGESVVRLVVQWSPDNSVIGHLFKGRK